MRPHGNPINSLKTRRIFREPQGCLAAGLLLFCSALGLSSDKRRKVYESDLQWTCSR
jgi:hypothetical protein